MSEKLPTDLDEAIRKTVRAELDAELTDLTVMPGGHSGVTAKARMLLSDGRSSEIVLKAAPVGAAPVGRHDVVRQARIISLLDKIGHVLVPEVFFISEADPNIVGMSLVPGQAAEPVLDDPRLPPEEVGCRGRSAARMLARVHATPLDAELLRNEEPSTLAVELARWAKLMNAVPVELRPNADTLCGLLSETMPAAVEPTLLHGDYRIGNTLCLDGEVRGVIDWEIWSVGDPRVDLGWFRLFCDDVNFPGSSFPAPGIPSTDELMAAYREGGGADLEHLEWFDAVASYKMAAVMGYNLRRHREGRHHDPYQETLVPTIRHLVDGSLARLGGTPVRS
jgi:aminoglycoside phosphotransferase (APT) family kinase protein